MIRIMLASCLFLLGGCGVLPAKHSANVFPVDAWLSPSGAYASISWYQEGQLTTDIYEVSSGRVIIHRDGPVSWGVFEDVAWSIDEQKRVRMPGAAGSRRDPSILKELQILRSDRSADALYLRPDWTAFARDLGPEAEGRLELVSCRFSEPRCEHSAPVRCQGYLGSSLTVTEAGPLLGIRCKAEQAGRMVVEDHFWRPGEPVVSLTSPDTLARQQLAFTDGRWALLVEGGRAGSILLRPLDERLPMAAYAFSRPTEPSEFVRSALQSGRIGPLVSGSGAWTLAAASPRVELLLAFRRREGQPEACVILQDRSNAAPARTLTCRRSAFDAEVVNATDSSGRPLTGHLYSPNGESKGLVVRFHGGPFVALPAMPENDVRAWLAAGMTVLDVGYQGGRDGALLASTAESAIPEMAKEAAFLAREARARRPDLPPLTISSGVSFGAIPALVFARDQGGVAGAFVTSPICAPADHRMRWARPQGPVFDRPYRTLMDQGAGDLRDLSCEEMLAGARKVFVAYSAADPVVGPEAVAHLERAIAGRGPTVRAVRDHRVSHTPFSTDEMVDQARTARDWFLQEGSAP